MSTNPPPALLTVISDVATALQAISGYGAFGTSNVIPVFQGPLPTSDLPLKFVLVGSDGDNPSVGKMTTDWLAFAPRADRWETGEVVCLAQSWDGAFDNFASKATDVTSMLQDLATAAYSLTESTVYAYNGRVDLDDIEAVQSSSGLILRAKATIHYTLARA